MKSTVSPASGYTRRSLLRRNCRIAAVLGCVAALATACADSSSIPGYASGKPTSALAFAQCMRAHGILSFPDPSGGQFNLTGISQSSSQFRNAARICGGSSPEPAAGLQAQSLAMALEFSRCMRAHGVRSFPDPVVSNNGNGSINITVHGSAGNGMDPNSPVFQAAMRACRPLLRSGGNPGSGNSGSAG